MATIFKNLALILLGLVLLPSIVYSFERSIGLAIFIAAVWLVYSISKLIEEVNK